MEVTNEIRAKIYGLYIWSAKFTHIHNPSELKKYDGLHGDNIICSDGRMFPMAECKLQLTPLEQITDEHAIEVVKLLVQHGKVDINDLTIFITDRTDEKVLLRVGGIKYHLYYNGNILCTSVLFSSDEQTIYLPIYNTSYVADYLRSKSYALPYLGIDLFKSGIAITPLNLTRKITVNHLKFIV